MLRVGAALPDPPFEFPAGRGASGFDPEVMRVVAERLGRRYELVRYTGGDFDGIFAGLDAGEYDVVASGATITEHRRNLARFCRPYVRSGQSLVVASAHDVHPINSVDDLAGRTLGVQRGNTSEPVAMALRGDGKVGKVRHYDYDDIVHALDDVAAGKIDAFMKLAPVVRWLLRDRNDLQVAQTGITDERLGVAVALADEKLAEQIDGALDDMRADGTLASIGAQWLQSDDPTSGTRVIT